MPGKRLFRRENITAAIGIGAALTTFVVPVTAGLILAGISLGMLVTTVILGRRQ